jgi:PAS domain S-box-containing protein
MAALLQTVLLGLMILIILATLVPVIEAASSAQEKSGFPVGNLFGFLLVLLPFLLLRRGYFHVSTLFIIGILILTPALAILVVFDLYNSGGILFQFTLAIILSGLLLNRRVLTIVFGLSAALVFISAVQAQTGGPDLARLGRDTAVNFILFNGLIALFLDRFGITLRTALMDSQVREGELQGEIASRKHAEQRFRIVVESAPDAILLVDPQGGIVMVNPQAEKCFGYSRVDLMGFPVDRLVPARYRSHHSAHREGFLGDPQTRPMGVGRDLHGLRKDGSEFPVEIGLAPIETPEGLLVMATIVDISERKKAEERLQRQNQRLTILREIDTAILSSDSIENIVANALTHIRELLDCQRASLALMDWDAEEFLLFGVDTDRRSEVQQGIRVPIGLYKDILPALERNEPVLFEDLITRSDLPSQIQTIAREGMRSLVILPLQSQGKLIGTFSMSSNEAGYFDEEKTNLGREVANQVAIAITQGGLIKDLQKLTEELEQRVAERTLQLESANRELEAFSYSVSHDLRAPLRAINGFSLALSNKHAGSIGEQGIHYLNRILENTRHMGELIDDLLTLSRITRREMGIGDVNLTALAQEIAGELRTLEPERQVTIEIEDQVEARGDAGLIRVVLHNLIGNAWKFTSSRPQAQIRFGMRTSLESDEGKSDEGETVYFVQDNGVGFDMAYAAKLFSAFQRLHTMAEFPGTGIGLATVQRIIHRHGGRIWADAELDKGAVFYFTLGGSHEKQ